MSRVCTSFLLPFHLRREIPFSQRVAMKSGWGSASKYSVDLLHPVRLFFETGVEVQICPEPEGLVQSVLYHAALPAGRTPSVLARQTIPWEEIFSSTWCSTHTRLGMISTRRGSPRCQLSRAILINAAGCFRIDLLHPHVRMTVSRLDLVGMAFTYRGPGLQSAPEKLSEMREQARLARALHTPIVRKATATNRLLRRLSIFRRIPIELQRSYGLFWFATELGTISLLRRVRRRLFPRKDIET